MLKQDASSFVALLPSSIIHTGLYTVANMRGVATLGAWLVGVTSSVGMAARRDREIEHPTSRILDGVGLELWGAGLVGEVLPTRGALFATKLFFITSDIQ